MFLVWGSYPCVHSEIKDDKVSAFFNRDLKINLNRSGQGKDREREGKKKNSRQCGQFDGPGLEEMYILLFTYYWLKLSIWPHSTVKQTRNGSGLGEKVFWFSMSIKFG